MPITHIFNAAIILNDRILKRSSVTIKDFKITKIGKLPPKGAALINARGLYLAPGFIDTHIHGSPDEIMRNETRYGMTAFVIAVSCGRPTPKISACPSILGIRHEGPFINQSMAGAQDKRFIRKTMARTGSFKGPVLKAHPKMMTLAPEIPGVETLIKFCKQNGVIPSIGHSDASYEEAKKSFDVGIRHATHLFNAMSGPRHGTAGAGLAALFDKRVTVEVIGDLKHVSAGLLRLVFAIKDPSKIILITDSVRAERLSYPQHSGRLNVRYAGGCSHIINCVKNAVKYCGVNLTDAVIMASANPARLFGIEKQKGSIAPGKDADIVLFDKNFNVKFTIRGGKIVYQNKGIR